MPTLEEAVRTINGWVGRPSDKPMVEVATCRFCGHKFPVAIQDFKFAQRNNGSVCGGQNCRREMFKENKRRHQARQAD